MAQWNQSVPLDVLGNGYEYNAARIQADIERLNQLETLFLIAKLNLITSDSQDPSPDKAQRQAFDLLLRDGLLDAPIYKKLLGHLAKQTDLNEPAFAINRPALLELFRWVSAFGSTESDNIKLLRHVRLSFIRALLSCGQSYGRREIESTLLFAAAGGTIKERQFQFLPAIRRAAVWGTAFVNPLVALGRTKLLLVEQFFDKYDRHKNHFMQASGGVTPEDWLICYGALITATMQGMQKKQQLISLSGAYEWNPLTMCIQTSDMQPVFDKFFERVAQTSEQLRKAYRKESNVDLNARFDFRPIRVKPILKAANERAIIVDERLFIESMSVGPLFMVTKNSGSQSALDDYGKACQNYAFNLLKSANNRLSDGLKAKYIINEPLGSSRPLNDILLGDETTVALIEAKGVWLNDDLLYEANANLFWEEIQKKYSVFTTVNSEGDTEETRKGVAQLFDVVKGLDEKSLKGMGDAEIINDVEEIIPILVVQDGLMATSMFPHQLALEFYSLFGRPQLPGCGNFQFGRFKLHSLITLSLFDIEAIVHRNLDVPVTSLLKEFSKKVPERNANMTTFMQHRQPALELLPRREQIVGKAAIDVLDNMSLRCFNKQLTNMPA